MARRYKYKGEYSFVEKLVYVLLALYVLYMGSLCYINRFGFYRSLLVNILVVVLIIGGIFAWREFQYRRKKARQDAILSSVIQAGLEDEVRNFINRFGMGKKEKNTWTFENHSFEWHQLEIFRKMVNEKGLHLSFDTWDDTLFLLKYFIQQKEERLVQESIALTPKTFDALSGSEFENLLYRLFEKMGYVVQKTGKTGDQGGDLIANREISSGSSSRQNAIAVLLLAMQQCNKRLQRRNIMIALAQWLSPTQPSPKKQLL